MRGWLKIFGLATLSFSVALPALAQDKYPSKPIEVLLSSALPQSRILMDKLSEILGVPFVGTSVPGANGNIAAINASKAKPDGYTMLYGTSALAVNPAMYKNGVDPTKGLTPVSLTSSSANALMVNPKTLPQINTINDFVAYAKANSGKMAYAAGPKGNVSHIMTLLFLDQIGKVQATHIPYDNGPAQATSLLSGDVQFAFLSPAAAIGFVNEKRMIALASTSINRLPSIPTVPTLDEAGLKGYDVTSWNAFMMPPGTPANIVQLMNDSLRKALEDPGVKEKFRNIDVVPLGTMSPTQYTAYLEKEKVFWGKFISESGLVFE